MRAQRIVETPVQAGHAEVGHQAPASAPAVPGPDLRVAVDGDLALASPVHALHAQLAEALEPRENLRIDPVRVVILLLAVTYTAAAWWGLVALGSSLVHHWIR